MSTFIPPVTRLSSLVTRVLGCNPGPMTLQGTNTYLVGSGAQRVLIDAGQPQVPEYIENLMSTLQQESMNIRHLVVTHWHHDHIGGVPDVLGRLSSGAGQLVEVHKFPRPEKPDAPTTEWPPHKWSAIRDGDKLVVDGATLQLVHTPGHTTDHVALYLEEEATLFSADCILGEGTAVFEDLYTYMQSLEKILELNPKRIYPGHGPVIEEPLSKIRYYIQHRKQREEQIFTCLQEAASPQAPMELVKQIYKDTPENLFKAAAVNVGHHLAKLSKEGRVVSNPDGTWSPAN